jgi:hypothetical protein
MKNKLEYRMYGFINYQLSGTIHAGIQFGHAVVEYGLKYSKTKEYQQWATKNKTFIILNGGTTNNGKVDVTSNRRYTGMSIDDLGTMQKYFLELERNGIHIAVFKEPDLNDAMTAIVFLVDERVFDKAKYPDLSLANSLITNKSLLNERKNDWVESIGGKKNQFLREFLKDKKLA